MLNSFKNSLPKMYQCLVEQVNPSVRYIVAALLSMGLALYAISAHNPVNVDGVLYLKAAATIPEAGLQAAMQVYGWPFYYWLLAMLSQHTHCSLEYAAHAVDTGLQILMAVAFVAVVKELGGSSKVQAWAIVVILLYHAVNSIRADIYRDFGYWGFGLLAVWFFLRFAKSSRWCYALGWGIAMGLATLFRVEGALFLVLAPFALLVSQQEQTYWQRVKSITKLQVLPLIALSSLAIVLMKKHGIESVSRIPELIFQFKQGLAIALNNYQLKTIALRQFVLDQQSAANAGTFFVGGLLAVFGESWLHALQLLYAVLFIYAIQQRLMTTQRDAQRILWFFIGINLALLLVFLAQTMFLATRYLIFLCLLMSLWVPFSLAKLASQWSYIKAERSLRRWIFPGILLWLLVIATSDVIDFGYSKAYILQAGDWIAKNSPQQSNVYSNSTQVMYYTHRSEMLWQQDYSNAQPLTVIHTGAWKKYDYLALRFNRSEQLLEQHVLQQLNLSPIQTYQNKRGDKILLFKVH